MSKEEQKKILIDLMNPLIGVKEWISENSNGVKTVEDLASEYAKYYATWHLQKQAEVIAEEAKTKFKQGTTFRGEIIIDKQSILNSSNKYIEKL